MRFDSRNVGLIGVLVALAGIIWSVMISESSIGIAVALLGIVIIAASQCQSKSSKK